MGVAIEGVEEISRGGNDPRPERGEELFLLDTLIGVEAIAWGTNAVVVVGGGTKGGLGGSSVCAEGTEPPPSLAVPTESETDVCVWDVVCGDGDIGMGSGLIVWRTLSSWFATARAHPALPDIGDIFWVYDSKASSMDPARTLVTGN